jgi:hypothetical protein
MVQAAIAMGTATNARTRVAQTGTPATDFTAEISST